MKAFGMKNLKYYRKFLYLFISVVLVTSAFSSVVKYAGASGSLPIYLSYSDVYFFAETIKEPGFPYLGKKIEYPVLTGLFIQSMWSLTNSVDGYFVLSSLFLILFALITSAFLYEIAKDMGIERKKLIIFWALAPSFIVFVVYNWDIICMMFFVISLHFIRKERYVIGSAALSLGFSAKFFPVLFLLPLLVKRDLKGNAKILASFVLTFIAVNGYFIMNNFSGWWYTYETHIARKANIDSVFGMISHIFPGLEVGLFNLASVLSFILLYVLILRKRERNLLDMWFLSALAFLIFSKVFSPQYLLWLLPFFILYGFKSKKFFYSFELVNLIVLFSVVAWYGILDNALLNATFLGVLVRHALLIYLFCHVFRRTRMV